MHEQEAALASRDYAGHQLLTGRCGEDAARPFLGLLGAVAQGEGGGTRGGQRNLGGEHRPMHNHFDHHLFTQGRGNDGGLSVSGGEKGLVEDVCQRTFKLRKYLPYDINRF